MYGQPAWKIYAEFKFSETGEVHSVGLDGPKMVEDQEILHKSIFMPYDAKKLIIWFKLWTYSGPDKYDSDYGKNYHFDITEPSIVFDKDWEETVHGSLKAGEMFDVYYDSKRLDEDKEIYLQAKFCEDCDVMTEMLLEVGLDTTYLTEVVPIPKDAKKVIMWFYHEVDGEKKYDSDYSKNYHFELASD